jgi:universal stress protein E
MTAQTSTRIESKKDNARAFEQPMLQKRVLCATDLSVRSKRAVARAALLARQLDAQLFLLHVIDPDQPIDRSVNARVQMAAQLPSAGIAVHRNVAMELRAGNYIETIAAVASEVEADVIVLGCQQRRGLAPVIGTTAERIIALAGRPVLIVNLDHRVQYGAVVIAADLSDAFARVVQVASSLKFLEAEKVSVVHGFESPYRGPLYAEGFDLRAAERNIAAWERAAKARLLLNLDAAGVDGSRFRLIFQQARPIRAIQRVVRSVQPDLLIVGTNDRSIFQRVTRGSVANDALRTIECDILVATPGDRADAKLH